MKPRHPRTTSTATLVPCPKLFQSGGQCTRYGEEGKGSFCIVPHEQSLYSSDYQGVLEARTRLYPRDLYTQANDGAEERGSEILKDIQHSRVRIRSEEHTSELRSLMRISYAVCC